MKAAISLDMKKKRIRIHKSTLDLLNKPENIVIMVNPDKNKIALCSTLPDVKDSLKVFYDNNSDCEYYSKELMEQLSRLKSCIDQSYTYRIYGKIVNSILAIFDINDAFRYDGCSDLYIETGVNNK